MPSPLTSHPFCPDKISPLWFLLSSLCPLFHLSQIYFKVTLSHLCSSLFALVPGFVSSSSLCSWFWSFLCFFLILQHVVVSLCWAPQKYPILKKAPFGLFSISFLFLISRTLMLHHNLPPPSHSPLFCIFQPRSSVFIALFSYLRWLQRIRALTGCGDWSAHFTWQITLSDRRDMLTSVHYKIHANANSPYECIFKASLNLFL